MSTFSKKVINWQEKYGRNNLPWQTKNPYHVWISEIMLQQTQVYTVIPYFQKFIKNFPKIEVLAKAEEEEILALWSGLGYYTRARNILKTAIILKKEFDSFLPNTYEDLISLPGIGASTAGAILTLAFEKPGIILDGNVKRVLLRYSGDCSPINNTKTLKNLTKFAKNLLPKKDFRAYSQGMMDLGSTLCVPKNPLCKKCPVSKNCQTFEFNYQDEIPFKTASKPKKEKEINWFFIFSKNKVLLKRNKNKGIWQNLWLFPEKDILSKDNLCLLEKKESLPIFTHNLSHQKLNISTLKYSIENKDRLKIDRSHSIWVSKSDSVKMGIPKPIKELINNYL